MVIGRGGNFKACGNKDGFISYMCLNHEEWAFLLRFVPLKQSSSRSEVKVKKATPQTTVDSSLQ